MPRKSVYGSDVEWAEWELASGLGGVVLNGWVRRALNEAAALERALAREQEDADEGRAERLD